MLYKVVLVSAIKQCESAISIYVCVCVCVCILGKVLGEKLSYHLTITRNRRLFLPLLFFMSITIWAQRRPKTTDVPGLQ